MASFSIECSTPSSLLTLFGIGSHYDEMNIQEYEGGKGSYQIRVIQIEARRIPIIRML